MSNLNENQEKLRDTLEGFIVTDAGPGTGKTHTIVSRYLNMINKKIDPMHMLLLTFTRNAAQEMKDRITSYMSESASNTDNPELRKMMTRTLDNVLKNVKASTFDAFCLKVVLNSPESVSDFFKINESLSRGARLVENETLNKDYFRNFYANFIKNHANRYIRGNSNIPALVSSSVDDLFNLIKRLMSRGVVPLETEWFDNGEKIVIGSKKSVIREMTDVGPELENGLMKIINKDPESYDIPDTVYNGDIIDFNKCITEAANEDRTMLLEFIRDVYFEYIRQSISDNRLTFGLSELFAFVSLYNDARVRETNSVDYMMVDEFQDTNELQMMICLLLLRKPNLCVVGDWKQGIYGFRFVSKENITDFGNRVDTFLTKLNRGETRIPFKMIHDPICINLDENYRSSSVILKKAFSVLSAKGSKNDTPQDTENVVELIPNRDREIGKYTEFESIKAADPENEIELIIKKILEYKKNEKYMIAENGTYRRVRYGDIAVLCRNSKFCRSILDLCEKENVPAFFEGDTEIMSTREGKLALAWLRYVNNASDTKGPVAILTDMGYPLSEIKAMIRYRGKDKNERLCGLPDEIVSQRNILKKKKRRPNDLLTTIFAFYGLDNDTTQTIINILSSAYTGSLLTISDIIRLIEEDIEASTKYDIDRSADADAVTIQTMHKSKGLEYPIVITAGINYRTIPSTRPDDQLFAFNDLFGIRCKKEYYSRTDDNGTAHEMIIKSWRYELINLAHGKDYSEERRLMFVAISRAKQYVTMTCHSPSTFFEHLSENPVTDVAVFDETDTSSEIHLSDAPVIAGYRKKHRNLSIHEIMNTVYKVNDDGDKKNGKGADYGDSVHKAAYLMARNMKYDSTLAEMPEIRRILDSLAGATIYPEIKCVLPVNGISLRGVMDIVAVFGDRVEIHDYKTDDTDRFIDSYRFQLSVYAHSAESMGKKVICYLDFVSQKKTVKIEPLSLEEIANIVSDYDNIIKEHTAEYAHGIDFK